MRPRARTVALALAIAAAVIGWRLARPDRQPPAAVVQGKPSPRPRRPPPRFLGLADQQEPAAEPAFSILDRAFAATELPPWSRLLETGAEAAHPARWSEEGLLPAANSQTTAVRYRLEVTPRLLAPGQPLEARLAVTGATLGRELVLAGARIVAGGDGRGSPVEEPVTWSVTSNGARFAWRPTGPVEQAEERALVVSLSRQGKSTDVVAPFRVVPEPPVRFDGRFGEGRAGGSLLLSAGLSVSGAGSWHCRLEGNVSDHENRPLLAVEWSGAVTPPRAEARFELYGLGLQRAGFTGGQLRLDQLRGTCQSAASDPSAVETRRWEVPVSPLSFQTAAHQPGELSDRPWDSPLRDRQIELATQVP